MRSYVKLAEAEKPLCANLISYDGKAYGIALPAKVASDVETMLKLAWQEQMLVSVDLHQTGGDGRDTDISDTGKIWGSIPDDALRNFGSFSLQKMSETSLEPEMNQRRFKIKNKETGEEKEIIRIHYTGWPDAGTVPLERLESLHKAIDDAEKALPESKGIVVNCHAGVGRTGTVFGTRHLRDKARKQQLDGKQLDAEVLNTLVHGQLSRNSHFIQTPSQLLVMREAARSYAELYGQL